MKTAEEIADDFAFGEFNHASLTRQIKEFAEQQKPKWVKPSDFDFENNQNEIKDFGFCRYRKTQLK